MGRIIVRVWLSRQRAQQAERELTDHAGSKPYRQGTSPELMWEFDSLERAQMFQIATENTPGVVRIQIGR
jgi:hypothetical protein